MGVYGLIIDCLCHTGESISKCSVKVVILPIGSLEYHGPHLPLSVDTLLADRLVRRYVEEGIDRDILSSGVCLVVLPPLSYGYSPEWSRYEGTVSIDPHVFQNLIQCIYHSVSRMSGFKGLVIVNGHGGNTSLLEALARDITYSLGGRVAVVDIWRIAGEKGLRYCHACLFEVELAKRLGIRVYGGGADREASLNKACIEGVYMYSRYGGQLGYKGEQPSIEEFIETFYRVMNTLLRMILQD